MKYAIYKLVYEGIKDCYFPSIFFLIKVTGIINIVAITAICVWVASLLLGETSYEFTKVFLQSMFGKFIILGLTWSFSFQILSEIRHLIMDMGYGFELKTTKITGLVVIIGSFLLTILIYLLGK